MNAKEVEWIMNDIYSSSTEPTWENDNANLRHDRNNNGNNNNSDGDRPKEDRVKKKGEEDKERG